MITLPKVYPILDAAVLKSRRSTVAEFSEFLRAAGITLLQYRDKDAEPQTILRNAAVIASVFADVDCLLIMNDRADFAVLAGFDGVHVGQGDLLPEDVKAVLAARGNPHLKSEMWGTQIGGDPSAFAAVDPIHAIKPHGWGTHSYDDLSRGRSIVGVSTHTEAQVRAAEAGAADYVAIGPVFATGTKLDAEAVVGLEGVRRARALTSKPLVAIGGITRENARSVIDAGADSVAVISGLFVGGESVEKVARDFIELLG